MLINIVAPMTFIPEKFVQKTRSVFIKLMEKIVLDSKDELSWKKFLLLPTVLFTIASTNRRPEYNRRLDLILSDDWDEFTYSSLKSKSINVFSQNFSKEQSQERITQLAKAGEIGSIMDLISRERAPNLLPLKDTVALLKSKHVESIADQTHVEKLAYVNSISIPESAENALNIKPSSIRQIIRSRRRLKKCGIDKMNFDILRILVGYGGIDRQDEDVFTTLLTRLVILILDNNVPNSIFSVLRDNELCGPPKKGGLDVRPIGMGTYLRKLCSIIFLRHTQSFSNVNVTEEGPTTHNKIFFKDIQLGMDSKGCEIAIHSFRSSLESSPYRDHFFADADNAFNRASRVEALHTVAKTWPIIIPFLRNIYGPESIGWLFSTSGPIQISSKEGLHQGCVLGSWLFCMAMQPLLQEVGNLLGDKGFIKSYIDDTNIGADFDTMCEALAHIKERGPTYGFHLKPTKGTYLMGKCGADNAIQRKEYLINHFGLDPSIIFIHPDDGGDRATYGAIVLGGLISPYEEYYERALQVKLQALNQIADNITTKIHSTQIQYLCLKWSFAQSVTHLQRSTPPSIINKFLIPSFSELKRSILCKILDRDSIPDNTWSLSQLNIQDGGLGLSDSTQISHAAYCASYHECSRYVEKVIPRYIMEHLPSFAEFTASLRFIQDMSGTPLSNSNDINNLVKQDRSKSIQCALSGLLKNRNIQSTHQLFTKPAEIAWILSLQSQSAGEWLDVCPKTSFHTFSNEEFEIALSLRLLLPQKLVVPNTRCSCSTPNNEIQVDLTGIHLCTGCNHDGTRNNTHNSVRDQLIKGLNYLGVRTIKEQTNVFRTVDPNNGNRPDITAVNLPGTDRSHLLDVKITSPIPACNPQSLTLAEAVKPLRAANTAKNRKNSKYLAAAHACNLEFLPIVFEITGRMHDDTEDLLRKVITNFAKSRNAPFQAVWKFWISSIIMTLLKSLAHGIIKRTRNLNGCLESPTHVTTDDSVNEIETIHCGFFQSSISL